MTDERWDRVKTALDAVLEQPAAKRARFLKRLCGHDPAFLEEVRSLVESYDDDYLEASIVPPPPPVPKPPETIGPYRVQGKIGAGGMGEVYKVVDENGETFALKRLIRELVTDKGLTRLRREASAASALKHPNIVRFVSTAELDGDPYIVMEYLEGRTLKQMLSKGRRLELKESLVVARQIAAALRCAHEKGIVHRDLKPGNILVTHAGRVKLFDFGIAKMVDVVSDNLELTKSGEILGTHGYMAPEQASGKRVDARADVFSFGCVLFEMLAGRSAFTGETPIDRYTAILHESPPRLGAVQRNVPEALDKLVTRMLAKEPTARPADMRRVLRVLEEIDPTGRR